MAAAPSTRRPSPETMRALLDELDDLIVDTEPRRLARRSHDLRGFSPILAERFADVRGDAVVSPLSVGELRRIVSASVRHRVPLTARGGGTGMAGESLPLAGGIVVDTTYLNRVLAVEPGWARAEAGCALALFDAALHERGQAVRQHPSMAGTATLGGCVATAAGGVGSVAWGTLVELGAVRAVRVMTAEVSPRLLELRGAHTRLAVGALGTTGIITEVELPTAPATRWFERVVVFRALDVAMAFAEELARADAIPKRLVSVVAAPAPGRFLFHRAGIDESTHAVLVMVAEAAREAFEALLVEHGGEVTSVASSPLYELSWQHTTLQALKHDRALTSFAALFAAPDPVARALASIAHFDADEVIAHVEFIRHRGDGACLVLPLVRYTSPARLEAVGRVFAEAGAAVRLPHRLLESAGVPDRAAAAFKREIDPWDLLNPGKAPPTPLSAR